MCRCCWCEEQKHGVLVLMPRLPGAAAQRERSDKRALPRKDILRCHAADRRCGARRSNLRALVWREPHSALLFCNSTPSGCPQVLSSETLGVMRSRVTPAGAVDAVLKVPLEFGQGCVCVCAARVRCAFPHNIGRAGLWSVATCHGKRARAAAASATPAQAAAFHLEMWRMR